MVTAVLWVVISLVGFIFAAVDVLSAYSHYNLVRLGWPNHEQLAGFTRYQFLSQFARMVLLLVFLVLGINALVDGPRGVSVYAMFAGNLVVVGTAIQSHRYRRRVFREERSEYRVREDEERRRSRESEDIEREESRTEEDLTRSATRAREDLNDQDDKEQDSE